MKWHRPQWPGKSGWLVALIVIASSGIFFAFESRIAGGRGFPLDDSWIHCRFASAVLRGEGLCFNPGVPSAGCTSPLWVLLLAAASGVTGEVVVTSRLVGLLLLFSLALATGELATRLSGRSVVGAVASVLVAGFAPFHWAALSGMEPVLSALLVVWGLERHLAAGGAVRSAAAFHSSALLGFAALARPENLLFFGLVSIDRLLRPAGGRFRALAWSAVHALGLAALLSPWAALNLVASGSILPEAHHVKSVPSATLPDLIRTVRGETLRMLADELDSIPSWNPIVILLLGPGLLALFAGRRRAAVLLLACAFGFPIVRRWIVGYGRFDFQGARYYVQALPFLLLIAAEGLVFSLGVLRLDGRRWAPLAAAILVTAAGLAGLRASARHFAGCVKNVNEMQVSIGRWLGENSAPGALVATNDVGAIAVFANREIIDTVGLVTPQVIPYLRRPGARGDAFQAINEDGLLEFLEEARPDYLVIFPGWYPAISARSNLFTPAHRVKLGDNIICGQDEMVVYRTAWRDGR